jgi:hypothetical protein
MRKPWTVKNRCWAGTHREHASPWTPVTRPSYSVCYWNGKARPREPGAWHRSIRRARDRRSAPAVADAVRRQNLVRAETIDGFEPGVALAVPCIRGVHAPPDLVIASKLGGMRLPDKGWAIACRPEELRELLPETLDVVRRSDGRAFAFSLERPQSWRQAYALFGVNVRYLPPRSPASSGEPGCAAI